MSAAACGEAGVGWIKRWCISRLRLGWAGWCLGSLAWLGIGSEYGCVNEECGGLEGLFGFDGRSITFLPGVLFVIVCFH